jgi:cellulose synthase/poly-beta-1,6-N-acetylglucosamine synthase-like glycosyltransferase
VLIASDGSSDDTVERARACGDPRVSVLAFEQRRGKAAVLDDAVAVARGEVIVFADARQRFEPGSLRALVACFADPSVGAVSGELCFEPASDATGMGAGVGFYWRYDKLIRRAESQIDSSVGATGAIYALRRELFRPIPPTTVLDDVLIPMQAVRAGYRVLFEPSARAYDRVARSAGEEFRRKTRTIAGTFALLAQQRWLLHPRRNRLWLQTLSHKGLRLLGPLALLIALASNLLLLASPFYRITLAAQVAVYACALFEHLRSHTAARRGAVNRLLGACYAFCVLQAATVVGFARFAAGGQPVTWTKARA